MARAAYWLTPPTKVTFIVSVVLVILACWFAMRMFRFP